MSRVIIRMSNSVGGLLVKKIVDTTYSDDETVGLLLAETLIALVRETGRLCPGDTFTVTEE